MKMFISIDTSISLPNIKTHKELAREVKGKRILLLNSYGKDAALCLNWLSNYSSASSIVSLNYKFLVPHPKDKEYLEYLKKQFPLVEFVTQYSPIEVSNIMQGLFQCPIDRLRWINDAQYDLFLFDKVNEENRIKYNCDYLAMGKSRYESFDRACFFQRNGLIKDKTIYPIGNMSKKQCFDLIRGLDIKIHPQYKMVKSTYDTISYYRLRSIMLTNPEFKKEVLKFYPMFELDIYRYEVLFERKTN